MASSPVRRPTAEPQDRRPRKLFPHRPRHYSVQSSPGPSRLATPSYARAPRLSSLFGSSPLGSFGFWSSDRESTIDADELAAVRKKQKWTIDSWSEKWRDADSDGEEVDLSTMTVYKSDGTVAEYNPPEPDSSDEQEEELEGTDSVALSEEDDSGDDPLGDWTEQEKMVEQQEVDREDARTARMRLKDPFFASDNGDEATLLELFMGDERRRQAKSRERSLSARPGPSRISTSHDRARGGMDMDVDGSDDQSAEPDNKSDEEDQEEPMLIQEVEAVIARAKVLRQPYGHFLQNSAFAVSESPEPSSSAPVVPPGRQAAHAANAASLPPTSYWKVPAAPTPTRPTSKRGKGKGRMIGERPSDLLSARSSIPETERAAVSQSTKPAGSTRSIPRTPSTAGTSTKSLDPYYYRSATYRSNGGGRLRTCRLCRVAGGQRALLAANCRGCISFKDCRFSREPIQEAQDTGADSAVDADLDDTPVMPKRSRQKAKRRSRRETSGVVTDTDIETMPVGSPSKQTHPPVAKPVPPTAVHSLEPKHYYHSLVLSPHGAAYRQCALCARAEGERLGLSFWCRGRISFRDCQYFDGDEQSYRAQGRRSTGKRLRRPMSEPDLAHVREPHAPTTKDASSKITPRSSDPAERRQPRIIASDPIGSTTASKSSYHPRLHKLFHGGYMHCKLCRKAGGARASKSGYCRGRMGSRLCTFLQEVDGPEPQSRAIVGNGRLTSATSTGDNSSKSTGSQAQEVAVSSRLEKSTTKRKRDVATQRPDIENVGDEVTRSAPVKPLRGVATSESLYDTSPAIRSSVQRKIARPRPKQPARTPVTHARPVSSSHPRPQPSSGSPATQRKGRERSFDIVIPVKPRTGKTPEVQRPANRIMDTPISPEVRPQRLNFGRPRDMIDTEGSVIHAVSSPLPPSSPPSEPSFRAFRSVPPLIRPTPPDSARERSTATPSGRYHDPTKQPGRSSLRQSSEMSDMSRSVKRARFSMPLSPSSDRGAGQPLFRIMQTRSETPSDERSSAAEESAESSDDDGFLLVEPRARAKTSSAIRPSSKHGLWSSSPHGTEARQDWSSNNGRLPRDLVARYSSAFDDHLQQRTPPTRPTPKRSLMLPPPVPDRSYTPSHSSKIIRSEPRPSHAPTTLTRPGVKVARPRAKSLAPRPGEQRHVTVF